MTREELKTKLIEIRHQIHMYPETAMEEYKTSDYIAGIMEEIGLYGDPRPRRHRCCCNLARRNRGKDDWLAGGY